MKDQSFYEASLSMKDCLQAWIKENWPQTVLFDGNICFCCVFLASNFSSGLRVNYEENVTPGWTDMFKYMRKNWNIV